MLTNNEIGITLVLLMVAVAMMLKTTGVWR